jgi:spore coat polysaccharide biosynthesis predicted glycosyltransferase SpsG
MTKRVLDALKPLQTRISEVIVIVGPANPHLVSIEQAASKMPVPIRIVNSVTDMFSLIDGADAAISAAGSGCWELAYCGVPTATIEIAENQRRFAAGLARAGVTQNIGWHETLDAARITQAIESLLSRPVPSPRLVDGLGPLRVCRALLGTDDDEIAIRPASQE